MIIITYIPHSFKKQILYFYLKKLQLNIDFNQKIIFFQKIEIFSTKKHANIYSELKQAQGGI